MPDIAPIFVALAAPIALGALCGIMNERSGVVNIGIEGMMLSSAFTAFLVAALVAQAMGPTTPSPIFGATIPILVGVARGGRHAGCSCPLLHAWLSISIRADQIISGTIINILALGLTGYLNRLIITPNPRLGAGIFQPLVLPDFLVDLPLVGWMINGFFAHGPIAISVLFLVVFLQLWLFRSRWGLRTRAVGEHPKAAETVGHRRHQAALPERHPGRHLRRAGRGLPDPRAERLVPERDDQRARLHRPGGGHLRTLDADRGVRGRAPLHCFEALRVAISLSPPTGQLGDVLRAIPPSSTGRCPTS